MRRGSQRGGEHGEEADSRMMERLGHRWRQRWKEGQKGGRGDTQKDGMRQKTLAIRSRAEGGTRQWERHLGTGSKTEKQRGQRSRERSMEAERKWHLGAVGIEASMSPKDDITLTQNEAQQTPIIK